MSSRRTQAIKFMMDMTKGKNKAIEISNTLMGTVMTSYCAAHYVWDGVHKKGQGDKLALKASLPTLEKCLLEVMERIATGDVPAKEVKKCAGRFLTLAPSRQSKNDLPLIFPWVYGQEEPK